MGKTDAANAFTYMPLSLTLTAGRSRAAIPFGYDWQTQTKATFRALFPTHGKGAKNISPQNSTLSVLQRRTSNHGRLRS